MTYLAEFIDGGPGCSRDDCTVTEGSGSTTLAYYPPIINAQGVNVNPDNNKMYHNKRCLACGKSWTEVWQNGARLN